MFEDKALIAENERLRKALAIEQLRVAELTKAVIALSDRAAFHALYPREKKEEVIKKSLPPLSVDPRKSIYVPKLSFQDVAEAMARKQEEGKL